MRAISLRAVVVAAMLGVSAPIAGCGDGERQGGDASEVDEQEQALLQERIQKGFAERPVE